MTAILKCHNCGRVFNSKAEDDPDTNSMEIEDDTCPACHSPDTECVEVEYPEPMEGDFV